MFGKRQPAQPDVQTQLDQLAERLNVQQDQLITQAQILRRMETRLCKLLEHLGASHLINHR